MKKIVSILLILIICFSFCGCEAIKEAEKEAQEPMTEEEYAAYLERRYKHYEVCSVFQYTEPVANGYGGVIRTEVCYSFTYLDGNSTLHSVDGFQHLEYGLTKICVGNVDEYVVDTIKDIRYLYLTKNTLSKLTGSAN